MRTTARDLEILEKAVNYLLKVRSGDRLCLCMYKDSKALNKAFDKFDRETVEIEDSIKHVMKDWEENMLTRT